jgi:hypothetical protein
VVKPADLRNRHDAPIVRRGDGNVLLELTTKTEVEKAEIEKRGA